MPTQDVRGFGSFLEAELDNAPPGTARVLADLATDPAKPIFRSVPLSVVGGGGSVADLDDVPDSASRFAMTSAEKAQLAAAATLDGIADGASRLAMTPAEKAKLAAAATLTAATAITIDSASADGEGLLLTATDPVIITVDTFSAGQSFYIVNGDDSAAPATTTIVAGTATLVIPDWQLATVMAAGFVGFYEVDGKVRVIGALTPNNDASSALVTAEGGSTTRSLAVRFGETINVLDRDVVGDGVTDDATALQAVFTAATSGKTIYLPKRTYALGSTGWAGLSLASKSGVRIISDGAIFKFLVVPSQVILSAPCGWLISGNTNLEINEALEIDCNGLAMTGIGYDGNTDVITDELIAHNSTVTDGGIVKTSGNTRPRFRRVLAYDAAGTNTRGAWFGSNTAPDEDFWAGELAAHDTTHSGIVIHCNGAIVDSVETIDTGVSGFVLPSSTSGPGKKIQIGKARTERSGSHGGQVGDTPGGSGTLLQDVIIGNWITNENASQGCAFYNVERVIINSFMATDNGDSGARGENFTEIRFGNVQVRNTGSGLHDQQNGIKATNQLAGQAGRISIGYLEATGHDVSGFEAQALSGATLESIDIGGGRCTGNVNGVRIIKNDGGEIGRINISNVNSYSNTTYDFRVTAGAGTSNIGSLLLSNCQDTDATGAKVNIATSFIDVYRSINNSWQSLTSLLPTDVSTRTVVPTGASKARTLAQITFDPGINITAMPSYSVTNIGPAILEAWAIGKKAFIPFTGVDYALTTTVGVLAGDRLLDCGPDSKSVRIACNVASGPAFQINSAYTDAAKSNITFRGMEVTGSAAGGFLQAFNAPRLTIDKIAFEGFSTAGNDILYLEQCYESELDCKWNSVTAVVSALHLAAKCYGTLLHNLRGSATSCPSGILIDATGSDGTPNHSLVINSPDLSNHSTNGIFAKAAEDIQIISFRCNTSPTNLRLGDSSVASAARGVSLRGGSLGSGTVTQSVYMDYARNCAIEDVAFTNCNPATPSGTAILINDTLGCRASRIWAISNPTYSMRTCIKVTGTATTTSGLMVEEFDRTTGASMLWLSNQGTTFGHNSIYFDNTGTLQTSAWTIGT